MTVLYFPQLSIGTLAQYPISRQWRRSASTNTLPDGSIFVMVAPRPPRLTWQLQYRGLSTDEWNAIQTLFTASQGSFGSFTFLDPTDNLIVSSEDLTAAPWTPDALLTMNQGAQDPFGGSGATSITNNGQSAQTLSQTLTIPSWFTYSFSVYLHSNGPVQVTLLTSAGGSTLRQPIQLSRSWVRATLSGSLAGQNDAVQFGIELPAAGSIVACAPQVEAQPSAGTYKPTFDRGGIYPNSRLDQDTLTQNTDDSGQYSTTLIVTTNG